MRILFISNHYPPSPYGWGCMQLCEEVANGLCARGHAVAVLTSTYSAGDGTLHPYPVDASLRPDPDWHGAKPAAWQFFIGRRSRERSNLEGFRRVVEQFRPDLISFWDTEGLPRLLLQEAERLPNVKTTYYLAALLPELPDEYIAYWSSLPARRAAKWLKRPLARLALHILAREGKPVSLQYENVMCVSEYMRRRLVGQGFISPRAVVVYNGVNLAHFDPDRFAARPPEKPVLRCLIAGRVVADKGIHTAVEAFGLIRSGANPAPLTLTILGSGPASYASYLRELVGRLKLEDVVQFRSPVPRDQMPEVLAGYHALLLPSEYDEPLARAMQEGMAMRLVTIGTTTGGSGELLEHERTGLVFEPRSAESLAEQLTRVVHEPQLMAALAENGRRAVVERFDIQHTITHVEQYLADLTA